jgi:hypothetical protein
MSWFHDLKLIRLFDFYLAMTFVVSTVLRIRQYRAVLGLIQTFGGRWPNLLKLVTQHRQIFLTWRTVLPLASSLGLLLLQTLASRLVWPDARLTLEELLHSWLATTAVAVCGIGMIAFDVWGILDVGEIDRVQLDKYFDLAEHWLCSWKAPVVTFFSFGYYNPRKIVAREVQAALLSASDVLNYNLRWIAAQAVLRLLFGFALWLSWAFLS